MRSKDEKNELRVVIIVEGFLTKAQLIERGWREYMMDYVAHDREMENPYYSHAPLIPLYSEEKIIEIENSRWFNILLESDFVDIEDVIEEEKNDLMDFVNSIDIKIQYMSPPKLTKKAIETYNYWNRLDGLDEVTIYSERKFLDRIKRNYVRHMLTNYDEILKEIEDKVGTKDAYNVLKRRIENRIDMEWVQMTKLRS